MSDKESFEVSMENLRKSVEELQNERLSLDEMIEKYKAGTEAAKRCLSILNKTENDIFDISEEIKKLMNEEEIRKNDRRINQEKTDSD